MTRKLTSQELCKRKDEAARRRKENAARRKAEKERERKRAEYKAKIDALPERWEVKLTIHKELMRDVRGRLFIRKVVGEMFMGMADELLVSLVMAWEENKSELCLVPASAVKKGKKR